MKFGIRKAISYTLIFILCVSSIVAIYDSSASASKAVASASQVYFSDVTGEMDLSSIAMQNLSSSVIEETTSATASYKQHTLIVSLDGNNLVEEAGDQDVSDYANSAQGKKKAAALKQKQDNFLTKLDRLGISYSLKNRYTVVDNAVAIEVNTAYVSTIKDIAGVKSVCLSETYLKPETVDMGTYASTSAEDMDAALQEAMAVVNKTSVYKTGVYDSSEVDYKGAGSVVAIIDTGLDYTHNAFIWDEEHESAYSLSEAVFDKSTIANALATGNLMAEERSALNGKQVSVNDLYVSKKIPFAYDYSDNDTDVYPSYSNHGTHVAGIVAGYDPDGYTDKNGKHVDEAFVGVAPQAQLVICKVFTDDLDDSDLGGAETEDILAALEDCILLGVDVINMSLGTSCGFSTTDDGDEEGEMLNRVYNNVMEAGISLVCAASNDYSAAYGGTFGTNLSSNPDSGTVGSPSVFAAALSVASISGQNSPYMIANGDTAVYYEESSDQYNKYYEFANELLGEDTTKGEFTYVSIPGTGRVTDFNNASVRNKVKGNIALVKRGGITFKEKVENAMNAGAIGIIVYNNVSGTVRMALGEVEDPIPSCCIAMEVGETLATYAAKNGRMGTIVVDKSLSAGPFMSEFSSWGATPDLKLKPEITAHGGEITSAVPGGYGEQSGTSMASPNMAGVVSIVRGYLKAREDLSATQLTQRINQLVMSTATIVYDRDNLPYSPRKQGAGLGSLANAISTNAYLYTEDASIDNRPKVNLGDDAKKKGVYDVTFKIKNFGESSLSFEFNPIFMTERLASNNLAVAEQAYILDDIKPTWTVNGKGASISENILTVESGADAEITVRFTLSDDEKEYIDTSFANGMYVEGFVNLVSKTEGQCSLNLPFLGFYGNWAEVPILDYSYEKDSEGNYKLDENGEPIKHINDAYYIDEAKADTSIDDEDKPQASSWATQPYTKYYNDRFSMPMGSFAYTQDENADRVYTTMEHNAISCYDIFYEEDHVDNYLATYEFRGLYLGLMRGARKVYYNLVDEATGEVLYESTAYRVNKAYSGGGSTVPGYLKFEINPLDYNMVSNGKYRMNFEFYSDYGDEDRTEPDDTYYFTFYCDYEAPSLREVRIRYQDYKENNQTKQRVYLDMDVYDNHYTQAALLCYLDSDANELKQVTEYVVPFYNCVKNSTNTVSIEITDIYEKYGDNLYVQFDDYALNHAVYRIDLTKANGNATPDSFELAEGESEINLDIYGTHKVSLVYGGDANISNFTWVSDNKNIADVKNGEIVGLSKGTTTIQVSSGNGEYKKITVNVSDVEKKIDLPSISFTTIINYDDKLTASDSVSLYPDQDITLTVKTDPWYYPQDKVKLRWESTNTSIVTVDANGKLNLIKKGKASVNAILLREDGTDSSFRASLRIEVKDPFVVSSYTLTKYRGKDEIVDIPDDEMIMYIGEDAFKDNSTMKAVIIPKTVINIYEGAFRNCSALERVYLVDTEATPIPDADLKLVYRSAFEGCSSLELLDLTNVKVITLAVNAFKNCSSLATIKNMKAIGSAYTGAFEGCKSLTSIDLTGMQVAGYGVFKNCTSIKDVLTGQFTAIGENMFEGCTSLKEITLNNSVVGASAFYGCSKLSKVTINGVSGENFVIEERAFGNTALSNIKFASDCNVIRIGDKAFEKTKLVSITLPNGLSEIGADIFAGTTTLKSVVLPSSFDYEDIVLASGLLSGLNVSMQDESNYSLEGGVLYNKDKTVLLAVVDTSVTSVEIPSTVTKIYDYAFANSKVTSITIPANVTQIGEGAFKSSKLANIVIEGNITEIKDETFNLTNLVSITLPSSVKSIGAYAFAKTLISDIDLGNVQSVGDYAFSDCMQLSSVTLTESLSTLGNYVFANCSQLETITIPAVKSMGMGVFAKSGVKNVVFGDNATTIGEYTFAGLTSLKKVVLGNGIQEIGMFSFSGCSNLEEVVIGAVKQIDEYAFMDCAKLKTISLSGVETIADYAFYNCNALGDIDLSSAVSIGDGAFMIGNGKGGIKSVKLALAEEIGAMAFYGTDIQSIELPTSLKALGYGSLAYTASLKDIKVANDNKVFFVNDGVLYRNVANGGYELLIYPATKVMDKKIYNVIDNTVRVDAYAFAGIGKDKKDNELGVTHVEMPYSLTNIGDSAFFESGITEYSFNSLNAPTLEAVHKDEVDQITVEYGSYMVEPAINAYYYSNFNTLFVYYTTLVGQKSTMTINHPINGVGYNNYVYSRYFGTVNTTATVQDATTTEFLAQMEKFASYTDALLNEWQAKADAGNTADYMNDVKSFSEIVQEARRLYGNIKDAEQRKFIDDELVERLDSVEITMRSIKKAYGIKVEIKQYLAVDGSYKNTYVVGETFDPTGIEVNRIYTDGSTEAVDTSKLIVLTEGALQSYMQTVQFMDTETEETFEVRIYVNESSSIEGDDTNGGNNSNGSSGSDIGSDGNSDSKANGMIAVYVCVPVAGVAIIVAVVLLVLKKLNKLGKKKDDNSDEN